MSTMSDTLILLCATPEEYVNWERYSLRPARPVPELIVNPDRTFCVQGDPDWCMHRRAEGRCCRGEGEFYRILRRQDIAS